MTARIGMPQKGDQFSAAVWRVLSEDLFYDRPAKRVISKPFGVTVAMPQGGQGSRTDRPLL